MRHRDQAQIKKIYCNHQQHDPARIKKYTFIIRLIPRVAAVVILGSLLYFNSCRAWSTVTETAGGSSAPGCGRFRLPELPPTGQLFSKCCFRLLVIIVEKQLICHVDQLCRHDHQMWLLVKFHRYDFQLIDKTTIGLASCIIM